MKYYQQGDVLLKRIEKLPEEVQLIGGLVLQEGETTGHKHQFDRGAAVSLYQIPVPQILDRPASQLTITPNGMKYLYVREISFLRHEEHKPISIEPGIYEIDIVREWDYDREETTRVVD